MNHVETTRGRYDWLKSNGHDVVHDKAVTEMYFSELVSAYDSGEQLPPDALAFVIAAIKNTDTSGNETETKESLFTAFKLAGGRWKKKSDILSNVYKVRVLRRLLGKNLSEVQRLSGLTERRIRKILNGK